jgi:D-alanyl-D-alanine carboxypeptidase
VTIRELLSHTAGFTDYPKDFDNRKDYTEEEFLKIIESIPPAYPPGTGWAYSNLGYVTLGILIHRLTGKFFGDFLKERLFIHRVVEHDGHWQGFSTQISRYLGSVLV